MKTPNLIVRIPEPCHEDWNSMQPDAKGKFCNSCSKAVFDFSTKTDHEIKQILLEYKDQKVCGHFKKSQVDRPFNFKVNLNDLPKNISFSRAFVIAVFLVFGSFLFSCTDHHGGKMDSIEIVDLGKDYTIGGLIVADIQSSPTDSIRAVAETLSADSLIDKFEQQEFLGGMVIQEVYPEEMMMGDVANVVEYVDGNIITEEKRSDGIQMDTVNMEEVPIVEYMYPLMDVVTMTGAVSVTETTNCFMHSDIKDSAATNNETENNNSNMNSIEKELKLFPNPSNGEFTVSYVVLKRSYVNLTVYSINGALIRNVVDIIRQYEGKYQIPVNLNEVPNGIYLVTLIIGDKKSVERLVIER